MYALYTYTACLTFRACMSVLLDRFMEEMSYSANQQLTSRCREFRVHQVIMLKREQDI